MSGWNGRAGIATCNQEKQTNQSRENPKRRIAISFDHLSPPMSQGLEAAYLLRPRINLSQTCAFRTLLLISTINPGNSSADISKGSPVKV